MTLRILYSEQQDMALCMLYSERQDMALRMLYGERQDGHDSALSTKGCESLAVRHSVVN